MARPNAVKRNMVNVHGAARGACQTPAGHSRSSLRSGRARVRSVWPRPALGALGSPRGARTRRALARQAAPTARGPSPAPRRWRLKTPTGPRARGLLKPISPRDVRYSVGSEGASACGSTASRAVCSSSMNSRKALLRAKDSLPSK